MSRLWPRRVTAEVRWIAPRIRERFAGNLKRRELVEKRSLCLVRGTGSTVSESGAKVVEGDRRCERCNVVVGEEGPHLPLGRLPTRRHDCDTRCAEVLDYGSTCLVVNLDQDRPQSRPDREGARKRIARRSIGTPEADESSMDECFNVGSRFRCTGTGRRALRCLRRLSPAARIDARRKQSDRCGSDQAHDARRLCRSAGKRVDRQQRCEV